LSAWAHIDESVLNCTQGEFSICYLEKGVLSPRLTHFSGAVLRMSRRGGNPSIGVIRVVNLVLVLHRQNWERNAVR
jgi:hypothetical protein